MNKHYYFANNFQSTNKFQQNLYNQLVFLKDVVSACEL